MTTITDNVMSPSVLAAMNPASKTSDQSVASAAQDRFMTLLVTQMKNQDPLNPLDNAQVTSQLAQLSTVTGIDKLNKTVEGLMGSYQASQSLQAASMIGHGVLVAGSSVSLASGKALFGVELSAPVDDMVVTIRDKSGNAVRQIDMGAQDAGTLPLQWDGTDDKGNAMADGQFTFDITGTRGGEKVTSGFTQLSFGAVASVSTGVQGVKLNIPSIGSINLADVHQIF